MKASEGERERERERQRERETETERERGWDTGTVGQALGTEPED